MMRKLAVVGALALVCTVPAGVANAADPPVPPCTVDYRMSSPAGYADTSGHTFVGGLSTVNRTVALVRTNCVVLPLGSVWTVRGPGFSATGTESDLVDETVAVTPPTSNRSAGLRVDRVRVDVVTPVLDDPTTSLVNEATASGTVTEFQDIRLKRRVIATKTDAAPEPVRAGTVITVKSRFSVADWSDQDYVALSGRTARLQSRNLAGAYDDGLVDATDVTDSRGVASTSFADTATRVWRFDFKGSATLGHVDAVGDLVRVSP
jgi:hypothetical protein